MELSRLPFALPWSGRSGQRPGDVNPLWPTIRQRTTAIGFEPYRDFIDRVFGCRTDFTIGDSLPDDPCQKDPLRRAQQLRDAQNRLRDHIDGRGSVPTVEDRNGSLSPARMRCFSFVNPTLDPAAEERRTGTPLTAADLVDRLSAFLGNGEKRLPYLRHIVDTALGDQGTNHQSVL
jgi:hypothetical protein